MSLPDSLLSTPPPLALFNPPNNNNNNNNNNPHIPPSFGGSDGNSLSNMIEREKGVYSPVEIEGKVFTFFFFCLFVCLFLLFSNY